KVGALQREPDRDRGGDHVARRVGQGHGAEALDGLVVNRGSGAANGVKVAQIGARHHRGGGGERAVLPTVLDHARVTQPLFGGRQCQLGRPVLVTQTLAPDPGGRVDGIGTRGHTVDQVVIPVHSGQGQANANDLDTPRSHQEHLSRIATEFTPPKPNASTWANRRSESRSSWSSTNRNSAAPSTGSRSPRTGGTRPECLDLNVTMRLSSPDPPDVWPVMDLIAVISGLLTSAPSTAETASASASSLSRVPVPCNRTT